MGIRLPKFTNSSLNFSSFLKLTLRKKLLNGKKCFDHKSGRNYDVFNMSEEISQIEKIVK